VFVGAVIVVFALSLTSRVPTLKMPVIIFAGRLDHWVPPETSVAWFDALGAPSKTFVWFEHSGHEMFVDEPEKFNATMIGLVRPLAKFQRRTPPVRHSIHA